MCQSLQGEKGQEKTRVGRLVMRGQGVSKNEHSEQDGAGVMEQGDESRLCLQEALTSVNTVVGTLRVNLSVHHSSLRELRGLEDVTALTEPVSSFGKCLPRWLRSILAPSAATTKCHGVEGLDNRTYFLTVTEVRSLTSRCRQDWFLLRAPWLVHGRLFPVSSRGLPSGCVCVLITSS